MRTTSIVRRAAALIVASVLCVAATVSADEIKVMTSGGFTAALLDVIPEFERATGNKVVTTFGASMRDALDAIPSRLQRGQPVDVLILADSPLDRLMKQPRLRAGTPPDP